MNKFLKAVDNSIIKMNKFSKITFTYGVIISTLTFLMATILYILSKTYYNYYEKLILSSNIMLEIFQLSMGAIIISILIDIFIKAKDIK